MASKKAQGPPDSMRSAFQESNYATPYTDHAIPGDHPARLPQQHRLGRDHAPASSGHLLHNMEVVSAPQQQQQQQQQQQSSQNATTTAVKPAAGVNSGVTEPSYGCHYILNSNHNGRRHYDEQERKQEQRKKDEAKEDQQWVSRKAYAPPAPFPNASDLHGRGKAKGAYHDSSRTAEDAAARAIETRKREMELDGGRRGYAPGPQGHNPIDLGLWHLSSNPAVASDTTNDNNNNVDILVIDENSNTNNHHNVSSSPAEEGGAEKHSSKKVFPTTATNPIVPNDGADATATTTTGGGSGGSMQTYVPSVRPEMGDIGYGSAYNKNYDHKYSTQARREQRGQREVNDDVKAVRDLPNW